MSTGEVKRLSDADHLLSLLKAWQGAWVPNLYRVSGVMVHSRIADLRKRGYRIECKMFGRGDYRYRLIESGNAGALRGTGESSTRDAAYEKGAR